MMNTIFLLTSLAFFIWIIRNSLFWVYLWQIKEYRLDRIYVHLKETSMGRKILLSPLSAAKWIVFFSYFIISANNDYLSFYRLVILGIFLLEDLAVARELFSHRLRKPISTLKSLFILLATIFFISLLFSLPLTEQFLWFIILDRMAVLLVALFVFVLWLPTEFYLDLQTERAIRKIQSRKDLLVIGVTGSYGKSTTKEYIAQILEKKYTVLRTKGTNNTLIGVVKTILSNLKKDTEIFVVEMGAYKRGEIAEICRVVNPKIGVITGIANQHLSLFGSHKNLMEAKYELIESLPRSGLSLFNGNSKDAYALYKKTKKKRILYKIIDDKDTEYLQIYVRNLSVKKDSVHFKVVLNKKTLNMKAPVIGRQNVENILPGIYIASYLGIKPKEIQRAVSLLTSLPKTMSKHKVRNGLTIIDDTFNAGPASLASAVDYMSLFAGIKVMVLSSMIELGRDSEKEHYRGGLKIGRVCDFLFLTDANCSRDIIKGIQDSNGQCVVSVADSRKLRKFFKEYLDKDNARGDIILFEGKGSGFILNSVL